MSDKPEKEKSTAIVAHTVERPGLALQTLDDFARFAQVALHAGIVGKDGDAKASAARAIVAMQYGAELNMPPMQALQSIHVVKGKPCLGAHAIAALIKGSGKYDYAVTVFTDDKAEIAFYGLYGSERRLLGSSSFDLEDAKRAGLLSDMYKKYPRNMLYARAMSQGARMHCADIFNGAVYTPEEMRDAFDAEYQVTPVMQSAEPVPMIETLPPRPLEEAKPTKPVPRPVPQETIRIMGEVKEQRESEIEALREQLAELAKHLPDGDMKSAMREAYKMTQSPTRLKELIAQLHREIGRLEREAIENEEPVQQEWF